MSSSSEPTQEPLLSLRAAVILLLGVQVAVLTAVLILLAGNRWPAAVLGAEQPSPAPSPSPGL